MSLLKNYSILIIIIVIAAALRLTNLATIPVGFNDDESAFGYNAYSILKSARDEWGVYLPFPTFESFGDWKLVVYLYLTALSQFFFGLNEFATRLPSAIFGILAVFATYLLTNEIFSKFSKSFKSSVALVASLLVAINPWHIVASRNAFESDLLTFFIPFGVYLFLKGLKNSKYLFFSVIIFVLAFYTYRSSWLFIPLLTSAIIFLNKDKLSKLKKDLLKNLILCFVLLIPLIPVILTFKGQSRFIQESFIKGVARSGIINEINENRGACQQNINRFVCVIIYNKYNFFLSTYVNNYFQNLSYKTFFEKANPTGFQSFATRSNFYLFELPFLIIGLIYIIKKGDQNLKILIAWLLFAPIGAAFAGTGNFGRLNLIMPASQIVAAFGLVSAISLIKHDSFRKVTIATLLLVVIVSIIRLIVDLNIVEPYKTSRYQRYGYKELFNYLESQKDYDNFYISSRIDNSHQYIHYLYFQKVDPNWYLNNAKRTRGEDEWVAFESIGKYKFVPSVPGLELIEPKSLVVVGEKEVTFPIAPNIIFNDLRGDKIFEVYDIDKVKEAIVDSNENI